MRRIFRRIKRFCHPPARKVCALSLCSLLMVGGVPPVGFASPARPQDGGGGIPASDAARFLEQATFGPWFTTDPADPNFPTSVQHVQDIGYEAWIQEQFNTPVVDPDDPSVPNIGTNYPYPQDPGYCDTGGVCWIEINRPATCNNDCNRDNYTTYQLQSQFYVNALSGPDQLRQRLAWSLTQIQVVSQANLRLASWVTPWLQVFDHDAFGNFRQLLYDITLNPAMGEYLNMRGNTRQNVNENYAREVLQLFSVGLNKLNNDGTVQLDDKGNPIPTYGQDEITSFARVFTGWNLDAAIAPNIPNYRDPMIVTNENNHDTNPKTLLDGFQVPAGLDAATELNIALDNIFNHPNVGPFIGRNLIQHLVTSNPSPDYVNNVATAFNTGIYQGQSLTFGSGNRGDMQAVIAAILLDPEARNVPSDPNYGHLREPVLFITNTLRALGVTAATTDFVLGESFLPGNLRMDQDIFRSPSVFNYYPPDNKMPCPTAPDCPFGPEFTIQSTSTALARINFIYEIAYQQMPVSGDRPAGTWIDTFPLEPDAAADAAVLVEDLNQRLLHGAMTDALRGIATNAVNAIDPSDPTSRVREAIYLIATSAQYQVER